MTTIATECNVCPEWVRSCAHFEGQIVILADELTDHLCCGPIDALPFSVGITTKFVECSCQGCDFMLADGAVGFEGGGDAIYLATLPDAEAEFERRCALL